VYRPPAPAQDELRALLRVLEPYAATPGGRSELASYASTVRRVYGAGDDYADSIDLLSLMTASASPELRTVAASAHGAVQKLIAASWIDPALAPRVHGLSIYYPQHPTADRVRAIHGL
jgi:hypothetical protein